MAIQMFIAALLFAITKLSEADYCYADNRETYSYHGSTNGPREWPTLFPTCNGRLQSPVDIQTKHVRMDSHLTKLSFTGYDTPFKEATVFNDGHTVMITPRDNAKRGITVQGKDYDFLQLHFHWGSREHPGAEHTLNGYQFEMEAHFVHRSSDNGTAVVGVLIKESKKNNKAFNPIIDILSHVQYRDDSTQLKSALHLSKLLPENPASYYGYTGSLTTPMCTEGVAWFVLKNTQTIGWKQLGSFMKIYSVRKEDKSRQCLLPPNNRPLQNLNGRIIYTSK